MQKPNLSKLSLTSSNIRYQTQRGEQQCNPGDPAEELHMHNCCEVYICLEGDISFLINNTLYRVKQGDVVFIRPYDVHMCIINSPCVHKHFDLWFRCALDQVEKFMESSDFNHIISLYDPDRNTLLGNIGCLEEAENTDNEIVKATCFFNVLNIILAQKKGSPCYTTASIVKIPSEMQKVLDFINENFISIEFISEIVDNTYVSTTTLNRWFKKYLHTTPREYLRSKKLTYARKLLDEGESVTGACIGAGFSDCSYFISIFKKKYGITPAKCLRGSNSEQ